MEVDAIRVFEGENQHFQSYLLTVGLAGVFARWVVTQRPYENSFGASLGSTLAGVAILGPSIGLPQASSCWVFSDTDEAFASLLARLREVRVGPVSFPLRFADDVRGGGVVSVDRLYAMRGQPATTAPGVEGVERLSRERLASITIPVEMTPLIGRIDDIPDGFPYYGIIRNKTLVALAESVVRDSEVATIQQVFTASSARGRGLGRTVVSHVALETLKEGLIPTYLVAEANEGSVALAEAVGFELDSRWGFINLR